MDDYLRTSAPLWKPGAAQAFSHCEACVVGWLRAAHCRVWTYPLAVVVPVSAVPALTILKLTPGGDGFARLEDGRPVFVNGAFPGDVVRLDAVDDKKQYLRVLSFTLLTASTARREPPCKVARACGGCDWMELDETAQHAAKQAVLLEALQRTGRFHSLATPITWRAPGPSLGYRQRVRLHFGREGQLGYFARRTHQLVTAEDCRILAPDLRSAVDAFRAVHDGAPRAFAVFKDVEVRAFGAARSLGFTVAASGRSGSRSALTSHTLAQLRALQASGFLLRVMDKDREVYGAGSDLGCDLLPLAVSPPVQLFAAPGAFTQVNWVVNQAIVQELLDGVAARGLQSFLDLYCGVGNFTLPLLRQGLQGVGVDNNALAIDSAQHAAKEQALPSAAFHCADVVRWLAQRTADEGYELLVLDPPRAGVAQNLDRAAALASRAVFICACDPVTFARDLRRWVDLGFEIESLTAYDMFPQTHHFEVTAWLRKTASPA